MDDVKTVAQARVPSPVLDAVNPQPLPPRSLQLGTLVAEAVHLSPATSISANFRFGQVSSVAQLNPIILANVPPSLGALVDFVGTWTGNGFNTIFRPDSAQSPTVLPHPVTGSDNILELNLTSETLSFSGALGSVPNRGSVQADAFLNGVPYLQSINDITIAGQSIGIHLEPGLWMAVPPTATPHEGPTLTRMASIPHGTTVVAQGTSTSFAGKPTIPPVDMTPFPVGGGPKIHFPSQVAANKTTPRIPQDLTPWITAGTITQAMLDDPNTVLRNHIAGQTITATTVITSSTAPPAPVFGGGTDNIAFLMGDPAATNPNAQTTQMTATFWIETVQHTVHIPIFTPGHPPLMLETTAPRVPGQPVQQFMVTPPHAITAPRTITFTTKQIQYSQTVMLKFKGLIWPHVSVATLIPSGAGTVPPSAWN